jgi:HK97 gp10 family phage protein
MAAVVVDISPIVRWNKLLVTESVAIGARVERAVEVQAREVEARAHRDVPVRTGRLKGTIATSGKGLRKRVKAGARLPRPYARFQEFGTKHHAAQPFLIHQANETTHSAFVQKVATATFAGSIMRGGG